MYQSIHHKNLFFIDRGMGNLEFSGNGVVSSADTEAYTSDVNWKERFITITIRDGITKIQSSVLEQFPNMRKLFLPKSVTQIEMNDTLSLFLHANDVLICASFGSYGDGFAQENNLRFLPEHIELGWYRNEEYDESTKLVLRFHEDGSMDLLYDIFTSGISAGVNGGASLERPMPEGYFPGCTLKQFADLFPAIYSEQIMKNQEVMIFLKREASRIKNQNRKECAI